MDLIGLHRGELRCSLHGPAWHGPSLLEVLQDVSADEAYARPLSGMHSIAELAAHSLAWIEEVTQRLRGGSPSLPARGDWPPVTDDSPAAFGEILNLLRTAGDILDQALQGFPAERLLERVGGSESDAPPESDVTYTGMLQGLAQHNAYHGGQISFLKHALRRNTAPSAAPQV